VTLTDAGPLIAMIDADEPDHVACMEALDQIVIPLVTTWPAFTEAMYLLARAGGIRGYLLARAGGIRAQRALWRLVRTDRLAIADLSPSAVDRSARLMDQYADRPMDLAAATLVALAEEQDDRRIFTLDADFQIYRFRGRQRFETIPAR
jgi:predicted nucleic acid-binding protein